MRKEQYLESRGDQNFLKFFCFLTALVTESRVLLILEELFSLKLCS